MILQNTFKDSKILNWEEEILDEEVQEIKEVLDNDGIIIMPSDTVYIMACSCFSESAIDKIYEIKKRAKYKPINVLTNSIEKINKVVKNINKKEQELIDKYMPGLLTIIFDKRETVPNILTGGLDTIGVRIPKDARILSVLKAVDYPLAITGANISGKHKNLKIEDVIKDFDGEVDIIIDGGPINSPQSSTIVKVENNGELKVIREGSIRIE